MKAMTFIKFCVTLLLTVVLRVVQPDSLTKVLIEMAETGGIIDGIFKPSKNGALGSGGYGITYKGRLIPRNNTEVAMKFYPISEKYYSKSEYEMYTYLGAVNINNNESVQDFGIPDIYYYGTWNNHTMLAMTLLDCTFQGRFKAGEVGQLNLFILFREFVRVIKYIHSQGVIHSDIGIAKMTIQMRRGFIFDFGMSLDMAKGTHSDNVNRAKLDIWKLLYSVFGMFQSNLPEPKWHWIGFSIDKDADRMRDFDKFAAGLAEDVNSNQWNSFTGMRRVFAEFAKHALDRESTSIENANGTSTPFYDHLYCVIIREMPKYGMGTTSNPTLSDIQDPFGRDEWTRPEVKYDLFEEMYAEQIREAREKK